MAGDGDRVAVTHRGTGAPDGLFSVRCDVTDQASVDAAFDSIEAELGRVEVLVSNAGITDDTLLMRMSEESFGRVVDANLTGAYRVAKRATAGMLRAKRGRMIFISSVVALSGAAGQANYAASKAGLIGLARSIARELGGRNITANVVAPGFIETEMTAVISPARKAEILASVPTKRFGTSAEVAHAVRFLASNEAAYLNGVILPVDGGLGMGT
jgi:3-oxoacyl-[acyl-carrier protein] reductase